MAAPVDLNVEHQPCPAHPDAPSPTATHHLTNWQPRASVPLVTECRHCRIGWADLDITPRRGPAA